MMMMTFYTSTKYKSASQSICVFHMILSTKRKYFPIRKEQVPYYLYKQYGESLMRGTDGLFIEGSLLRGTDGLFIEGGLLRGTNGLF